ncbi:MAG: PP2C family protein-serine/threonine phosphatase [Lachnospiraceae bacterium]|nr:PP2C family protein-serine/threonine phosphatase [Lachnospiraceae bacterium]
MKSKMTKRKRMSLRRRIMFSIILLSVLISAVSCLVGYLQYENTIRKLYNENGYVIGDIIMDQIDHDKIADYAINWSKDNYYEEMTQYLKNVEKSSGCAFIYIAIPDKESQTIKYIYDSSGLSIGDSDTVSALFDEMYAVYETGERQDNKFVRKSPKYGYLTSSIIPIKDSNEKVAALLFVDVHMQLIVSTLMEYVLRAVLISGGLLLIFCILYWYFMKQSLIVPISIIRKNAHDFAESDGKLTDTLEQVQTGDELQELADDISMMEHAIVQYIAHIQRVTAEKERIGAELNVATQIQADMLPSIFPAFPGRKEFDIYASMHPAKEVGGDFYDFFLVDDDHLALVMADVSGKGVPAALFMVIAKTLIKNRTQMGGSPSEILCDVNEQLCEGNEAGLFVTVWLAILEISTGKGIAANAGHEHPVLKRKDGSFELIKTRHSPAVAAMEGIRFRQNDFRLYPGDRLYVYTDGVPEATNAKDELFGTDRMLTSLNQRMDEKLSNLLDGMKTDIGQFVGAAPQFDDITMLCLDYYGAGGLADEDIDH